MAADASQLIMLLPECRRLAGRAPPPGIARLLARADVLPTVAAGEREQLTRYFHLLPTGWPMAAMTRELEVGDARPDCWLRADPVYVRADMSGARLLAWGNLALSSDEAQQLVTALQQVFAEAGFELSFTQPGHWYLRLPADCTLPELHPPAEALGAELLAHLPSGEQGRLWRALLNDAQIILHNHPVNQRRFDAGTPPANSLWFWGGGRLPDTVHCPASNVLSEDLEVLALAKLSGATRDLQMQGDTLIDCRQQRDWAVLEAGPLRAAQEALREGRYDSLLLDFADGSRLQVRHNQRWRFWRRPTKGNPS